jgi:hypothetical protein
MAPLVIKIMFLTLNHTIVGNRVVWKVGKILTLLKNITRANYALVLLTNLCLTKEIWNNNKLKGKKQWSESKPNRIKNYAGT